MNRRSASPVCFDSLESRRLFAVAIGFVAPDKLTFTGNAADDTVVINDNGAGTVSGQITNAVGVVVPFGPVFGIKQLDIKTLDGNDYVSYNLSADPTVVHNHRVDLGVGDDVFKMNATADIDFTPNMYLLLNVQGGLGKDYLAAYYRGEMDGQMDLTLDAGWGDDRLITDARFDAGSTGAFFARELGNDGNDSMNLLVRKTNPADPIFLSAFASGGNGIDSLQRTIWASNDATCEFVAIVP